MGQATFFLVQFAASVVLARLLTPGEMGVFAVGMAVLGLIGSIEAFGMLSLVIREPDLDEGIVSTAFTINLLLCSGVAAGTLLLSLPAGRFFHQPGVTSVMTLLAFIPLMGTLEFRPLAMMQRDMLFGPIAFITAIKAIVSSGVTVLLAFKGYSYISFPWGMLAGGVASLILSNILGWRYVSFRPSLREWRRLAKFGAQMLAIAGLSNVATRAADLICGRLLGLAALGVYARASNLTNSLFNNIHVVAGKVMFSDFAKRQREEGSLRASYLRTLEMTTALLWPMFAGIAVLSRPVINWLYGPKWIAAAAPLSFLCLACIILVAVSMAWEVFVVRNETARQIKLEATRTSLGLGLFSLGCTVGLAAAAAGRVAEGVITFFLYRPHLARLTDTTNADAAPIYGRSALLTLLATGPAIVVMQMSGWPYQPSPFLIAATVVLGLGAWLAGVMMLRHPLADEISGVVLRLRPKPA